jgi:RNA polymerase sigma-70 factor (ECF subfamily)
VQGFFTQLLERNQLAVPDPQRGRFRSWLLAALKHYLSNERDRENALKRGGGQTLLSIECGDAEGRFTLEPVEALTPERAYERRWALTLLEHVLTLLRDECHRAGKGALFDSLKGTLTGDAREASYQEVSASLGLSPGAVKVAAHRLRARYRELLRGEIAQTVERAEDVDDELRLLLAALE